jgi:hypothetical protein
VPAGTPIKPAGDDQEIEIAGPIAQATGKSEEECVFKSDFLDCYHYSDNDRFLVAEVHADFETNEETGKLQEVPFEYSSSTHELVKSPYETGAGGIPVLWTTQMNSGQIIKVTPTGTVPYPTLPYRTELNTVAPVVLN